MAGLQDDVKHLTTTYNEAVSKLDYFILGVTLAICAYLAQTNPYAKLGANKETFLLASLLVFASSAVCGFKRIEAMNKAIRMNAVALEQPEPQARAYFLDRLNKEPAAQRWYAARNYLLGAGLFCYLATKVWAAYQNTGWILVH
ncbi:hypothetical protein [Pseudomonas sp. GW101-3H06]|uniref:hypothetical protein n=1 Tax=Pseudomonas sp. GW101-3H06 TaxID=2751347 RepID=UPI001A92855B|nr:hypothetical protein [Pseudomonas sp. GW101-3H06]